MRLLQEDREVARQGQQLVYVRVLQDQAVDRLRGTLLDRQRTEQRGQVHVGMLGPSLDEHRKQGVRLGVHRQSLGRGDDLQRGKKRLVLRVRINNRDSLFARDDTHENGSAAQERQRVGAERFSKLAI